MSNIEELKKKRGCIEKHIQRPLLFNEKCISKIIDWKFEQWTHHLILYKYN